MTRIALFTAVLVICGNLAIPTPVVPFTLQVFGVALIAFVLPRKEAMLSVFLYILMGFLGIPVFSGWTGGLVATMAKPTVGFIIGFLPMVWVMSSILRQSERYPRRIKTFGHFSIENRTISSALAAVSGIIILYACGLWGVYLHFAYYIGSPVRFRPIFLAYCIPFLPIDCLKYILSYLVGRRLKKIPALLRDKQRQS